MTLQNLDTNRLCTVCGRGQAPYNPDQLVCTYSRCLWGDFVHDDVAAIVTNKDALGKSPILNLFHNDFWGMDIKDRWGKNIWWFLFTGRP